MRSLAALAHRPFRRFFVAHLLAAMGAGMTFVAAAWTIQKTTGSAVLVGALYACSLAGGFLAAPWGGVVIDRHRRRDVLAVADLVRAGLVGALALAAGGGTLPHLLLFVGVAGVGAAAGVAIPAGQAYVQETVPDEHLGAASGLRELCVQLGFMAAGAVTGLAWDGLGLRGVLWANAALFAASSATLFTTPARPAPRTAVAGTGLGDLADGARYLARRPLLAAFGVASMLPLMVTVASNAVLPAFVEARLGGSATVFGWMESAYSAAALGAGLFAAGLAARFGEGRALVAFTAAVAVALAAMTASGVLAGSLALYAVFGFGNPAVRMVAMTTLMRRVPRHLMGRVASLLFETIYLGGAVALLGAGAVTGRAGPGSGYLVLAAIEAGAAAALLALAARGFFAADEKRTEGTAWKALEGEQA